MMKMARPKLPIIKRLSTIPASGKVVGGGVVVGVVLLSIPPEDEDEELLDDEELELDELELDELLLEEELDDDEELSELIAMVAGFILVIILVEPSSTPAILVFESKLRVPVPSFKAVALIITTVPVPDVGLVGARMAI